MDKPTCPPSRPNFQAATQKILEAKKDIEKIQRELDEWLQSFRTERTHLEFTTTELDNVIGTCESIEELYDVYCSKQLK